MWAWAGGQGQQPWLRGRPRACPGCCVFVVAGGRRRAGAHPHHHHRLGGSSATLLLNKVTSSRCTMGTSRITSVRPSWSKGKMMTFSAGRSAWKLNQRQVVSGPRRLCPHGAADEGPSHCPSRPCLPGAAGGGSPEGDTREPQHRGPTARTQRGQGWGTGGQPRTHTDHPEAHRLPSQVTLSLPGGPATAPAASPEPVCVQRSDQPSSSGTLGRQAPAGGAGDSLRSLCRAGHHAAADKTSLQVTSP